MWIYNIDEPNFPLSSYNATKVGYKRITLKSPCMNSYLTLRGEKSCDCITTLVSSLAPVSSRNYSPFILGKLHLNKKKYLFKIEYTIIKVNTTNLKYE